VVEIYKVIAYIPLPLAPIKYFMIKTKMAAKKEADITIMRGNFYMSASEFFIDKKNIDIFCNL